MPLSADEAGLVEELLQTADIDRASSALGVLMYRYKGLVYAIAVDLARDRTLADDVFQETFVRMTIWLRTHPGVRIESFRRLLAAFVRRTTLELARGGKPIAAVAEPGFDSPVIAQIYAMELMDQLPELWRRVLELTVTSGYSSQEAATRLGLSAENVRVIKHRALRLIRTQQDIDLEALR